MAIVIGFGWPHIAFWLASREGASPRAERLNVMMDGLFSGIAAAVFSFRVWPVTALFAANVMNGLLFGGPGFVLKVVGLFLVGSAAGSLLFRLEPPHFDTEPLPTALSIAAIVAYSALIAWTGYRLRLRQRETRLALEKAEGTSQALLANVFPASIIPRLRAGEAPIADQFADVTVVFADVVEFTPLAERLGPKRTVLLLNELFRKFDQAALRLGVEKIETTGDGYLAVGGAPGPLDEHAELVAQFALEVLEAARSTRISETQHVQVRIGIHTGPVFAGVIGESRFHYKIFGETVNTASRIQSQSQPGRVLVSEATYKRLKDAFRLEEYGTFDLKGHGPMRTYWLLPAESVAR